MLGVLVEVEVKSNENDECFLILTGLEWNRYATLPSL